jgi:uncharacterized repeat protein (TIGR01451 family)
MKSSMIALTIGLLAAAPAAADDVTVALETFKLVEVVQEDGSVAIERREPRPVLPGDRILYRINMENAGDEAAADITMTLPIAEALTVDPASFAGDIEFVATFAIEEDPETFMAFGDLTVPTDDGGTRSATPDDLGALRIEIAEFPAQATAFVEYEANVR